MALRLLIDGYNVIAPVAPPSRSGDDGWLQRERMRLIRRLTQRLGGKLAKQCRVVFDAANPPKDRPHQFDCDGLSVSFAVDYPEADDLLEEIIASHSAPKRLAVVSSDHRVQIAATRRGCSTFDSQPWMDDLLDGKIHLAGEVRTVQYPTATDPRRGDDAADDAAGQGRAEQETVDREEIDVERWLKEFGF